MKSDNFIRFRWTGIILSIMPVLVVLQMVRIQTDAAAPAINHNTEIHTFEKRVVKPERGNIYDRWGRLLAGNVEVYEISVDLQTVIDPETIATEMATVLNLDYKAVLGAASMEYIPGVQSTITLTSYVSPEKVAILKQDQANLANQPHRKGDKVTSLQGLVFRPFLTRSYPEKSLASNVLGFYQLPNKENPDGGGVYGVEQKYNDLLSGTPQEVIVSNDPYQTKELPNIPPGASLVLTIDREIQAMTENVLDHAVESNQAASGTIVVANPRNGEILAMASTPRMDVNQYWQLANVFTGDKPFNRAVEATYESGSVFKVLTMASALDAGVVSPDTPFTDTGEIEIDGVPIYNWDRGAWGPQTMTTCMQHSLNVCLTWVAIQLGPTRFYEYLQAFGIGHRTNIDLSGEVVYPLAIPGDSNWHLVNLGANSFGQAVSVTPIQMVMAISALANDGKMMAPHVLKAVINDGRQYDNPPQVVGTPISAKAAREISEMLATSIEQEASDAYVEGYRMAGKTGTGEIPTEFGYTSGETNASFVGWGPVDDPKFLVYIWLEKPKSSIWGSIVAAPVFSEIVYNLVKLLDLPPDATRLQLKGQ